MFIGQQRKKHIIYDRDIYKNSIFKQYFSHKKCILLKERITYDRPLFH